jgi:hypothetical protein
LTTWAEFESAAPELAATAKALFEAHTHMTLATLRKDGSPRISGTECKFEDGELTVGSMPGARKARDLFRDPRFALHSGSTEPDEWPGDAKCAGRMVALEREGEPHFFRADLTEVVVTSLNGDRTLLVVVWWTPAKGVQRLERA